MPQLGRGQPNRPIILRDRVPVQDFSQPFPASIAGDNRTLLDQNSNPWYTVGDSPASAIAQLSNADQDTYLADRQSRGIKFAWVNLLERKFSDHAPNDIDNNAPFTGTALQSGLNGPYWARVDRFFNKAADYGITILAFPCFLGFAASGEGWETEATAASNGQMTTYGTLLGIRYAGQKNVIWVGGGDQNPNATLLARTDAMMAAIRAVAPQLMTTHQVRGSSGFDIWSAYTWRDINSCYVDGSSPTTQFETVYAQESKPAIWIEGKYENETGYTGGQMGRAQIYSPMIEHGAATLMGTDPLWFFGSSTGAGFTTSTSNPFDTWQHNLASPLSLDAARAASFIASYTGAQWKAMVPGTGSTLVTTGEGTTTAKAAVTYDATNGRAVAYFPSSRSITLDLSVFTPTSLRLRWFDPTNGSYTAIGTYANTSGRTVTYPTSNSNSAGADDWLLVIDPSAGTANSQTNTGTVTPAGVAIKATAKIPTGAVTATGKATKAVTQTRTGAVTPAGAISQLRAILRTFAGTVTPSGALAKAVTMTRTGTVTPAGAPTKATSKSLAGTVTPAGAMSQIRAFLQTLVGTVTPTGKLTKADAKTPTGSVTPTGATTKAVTQTRTGTVTPTGRTTKATSKTVIGLVTATSSLRKTIGKLLGGIISAVGALTSSGGSTVEPPTITGRLVTTSSTPRRTTTTTNARRTTGDPLA